MILDIIEINYRQVECPNCGQFYLLPPRENNKCDNRKICIKCDTCIMTFEIKEGDKK
nr:MAG: zinc-ribbon domain protein [Bacteriophage sp.]